MLNTDYIFWLSITSDSFDKEEILSVLSLNYWKIVTKNQKKCISRDSWIYRIQSKSFEDGVLILVDELKKHNDELLSLKKKGYILDIRCSVVSESGQIGWSIPETALSYFTELGTELDFSVFSYGLVEDT